MPPQVKVDEDLPEAVAELFTAAGYPATTVRTQGWSGLEDAPLWARVQAEGRWLVTAKNPETAPPPMPCIAPGVACSDARDRVGWRAYPGAH